MYGLLFLVACEELANDPSDEGADEGREEGEDDSCVEVGLSLVYIADVFVFDAMCFVEYIF